MPLVEAPPQIAAEEIEFTHGDPPVVPKTGLSACSEKKVKQLWQDSRNINGLGVLWSFTSLVLVGLVVLMNIGISGASEALPLEGLLGGAVLGALGFLHVYGAYVAFARPASGQTGVIVLSTISLASFPVGTAVGVIGLIASTRSKELFGIERFRSFEINKEWKQRKKDAKLKKKELKRARKEGRA
ncbi:MAG: hypothetical protein V3W41_10885 [Planctomycetota bacterium]